MKCPECGNTESRVINSEEICQSCGLVLDESITNPFLEDIQKHYAQQPNLATAGSRRYDGKIVKYEWLFSSREKNLELGNELLEIIASRHNLKNNIIMEAKNIFHEAIRTNFNIGRDTISIVYASVYLACNITKTPKLSRELALNSGITKTILLKTFKQLKRHLNIRIENLKSIDLVERFGNKLKLDQTIIQEAIKIIEQVQESMQGKKPETIVAAALYIASKKKITQRQTANAIGIMEVTIRKRTKEITKHLLKT